MAGVNYYEHHLGDWAKDVRGLSMTEEGAYRRLLDAYYSTEQPLPGDMQECFDIAGTRDESERRAVRKVLGKFFQLHDDGKHHQKRTDAEIGRFRERSDKAKKAAKARWKDNGKAVALASVGNANASPEHVPQHSERNADAMRAHPPSIARAMHSQEPVTSNQTPEEKPKACASGFPAPARSSPGEACRAMREAGLADVNPSNPTLATMLQQGMTTDELADAAAAAVRGGKGFAWALTRAAGQRADAARVQLAAPSARDTLAASIKAAAS